MLYLSRLLLEPRARAARRDLDDVQQLHRTVLSAFPAAPDVERAREHFGVLFRAEPAPNQPLAVQVLVQSNHAPDWSRLPLGYLAPPPDGQLNPAVRPLTDYEHVVTGMTLRFRLRANPTKRISKNDPHHEAKWHGKRVELWREQDQLQWIGRKAEQSGFRLLAAATHADVRVDRQKSEQGWREIDGQRRTLTFGAALFEGLLEVQDVARFRQALTTGIGSGKAYGFGLLSIASVERGAA